MSQLNAESFQKGEGTRIVSFVAPDKSTELDIITVEKNMPETPLGEVWLKNDESSLIATAIEGSGRIAVRQVVQGVVQHKVMELGDPLQAAHVLAGEYYAWENDNNEPLVAAASFTPAFNLEAYSERTESELLLRERLVELAASYLTEDDVAQIEAYTDTKEAINYTYARLLTDTPEKAEQILKKFNIIDIVEE